MGGVQPFWVEGGLTTLFCRGLLWTRRWTSGVLRAAGPSAGSSRPLGSAGGPGGAGFLPPIPKPAAVTVTGVAPPSHSWGHKPGASPRARPTSRPGPGLELRGVLGSPHPWGLSGQGRSQQDALSALPAPPCPRALGAISGGGAPCPPGAGPPGRPPACPPGAALPALRVPQPGAEAPPRPAGSTRRLCASASRPAVCLSVSVSPGLGEASGSPLPPPPLLAATHAHPAACTHQAGQWPPRLLTRGPACHTLATARP